MFQREYRLKHMKDFDILFREGKTIHGTFVFLRMLPISLEIAEKRSLKQDDLKIGVVVGTKVDKRAVVRNSIKRKLREALRPLLKEKKIKQGYLLALVAKSAAKGVQYDELASDVSRVLKKAGILQ